MGDLNQLHPKVKELALKHIAKCKEAGIDLLIYCTYRSIAEQNEIYKKGRTIPGNPCWCGGKENKVGTCKKHPLGLKPTNAKGGQSFHNYHVAYDCGPMIGGNVAWNREDLFKKVGTIGESLGLEWGGHFKSIVDLPHFQYTGGLTLKDFQAGKTIK